MVPCHETGLALVWSVRMTSDDAHSGGLCTLDCSGMGHAIIIVVSRYYTNSFTGALYLLVDLHHAQPCHCFSHFLLIYCTVHILAQLFHKELLVFSSAYLLYTVT